MIINHATVFLTESYCFLCHGNASTPSLICESCWCDLLTQQPACTRCGRSISHQGLCSACLTSAVIIDPTVTLAPYQFPIDQLLLSLKYKNQLLLAREFGRRLAEKVLVMGISLPDHIVPVPLHPARLISRGYNQALEIARGISEHLSVPVSYLCTKRIRHTQAQFSLKPDERRRNVNGAFMVNTPFDLRSVAIVDDIVTTGHTANELARQLRAAGVTKVQLWACAHAG